MARNATDSSSGDLTHDLYSSFKSTQQQLSSQLWDLFSIAELNASFAQELLAAHRSNKEAVDRVYGDLDEVARESADATRRTEESLEPLQEARNSFGETRSAVDRFGETLEQLREQFDGIRRAFSEFQNTMDKISKTLEEIDDVSDLTHLLALNASIEAARAGQHGVGFKVVAEEIKKLSDKSAGLTEETNTLLSEVQTTVSQALSNLGSYDEVRSGVDSDLAAARNHLEEQSRRIDQVDENVRGIAESMQRQSERTSRIHDSMDDLQQSAGVAADASRHVTTSLRYQSDAIGNLQRLDGEQRRAVREHTERLQESGVIAGSEAACLVGHDVAYPPWVSVSEGRSQGISIDIMQAVAKEAGIDVLFEANDFEDVLQSFLDGAIGIVTNVGWPNPAFDGKEILITKPYASFKPTVFALGGEHEGGSRSAPEGLSDPSVYSGRRVAAQRGSYVAQSLEDVGAEIVFVENDLHGMAKVVWREVDGLATEQQVGRHLSRRYFDGTIVETSRFSASIDVVMVVHEDRADLRDAINTALESAAVRAVTERLLG